MNRKFAVVVRTLSLVLALFGALAVRSAGAQAVPDTRYDTSVAPVATAGQVVPLEHKAGGEANLIIPDLSQVSFMGGIHGRSLLNGRARVDA
jgi:hypothetical protein